MTDGQIILGGVVFTDYQIPNKIPFGGKQAHRIHDMIGGQRFVDAMGPNAGDKSWTGRFRGASALQDAQAVDAMRIAGAAVELTWLGLSYTVLVCEFTANTERFYEVPYSITCVTVDDPAQDGTGASSSLDSLVDGDDATAGDILASPPANLASGLASLTAAISAAPQLQAASATVLGPLLAQAEALTAATNATITANDPALDAASPDGTDPSVEAAFITNMVSATAAQSQLADGVGFVSRIALNIGLAGG